MSLKLQISNCFGQLWLRVCADIALLAGFRTHMTKPREGQWVTSPWIPDNSLALVVKLTDNYWTLCMDMYILRGSKVNIGKDSNAGRDWGQEEKGTTEDEMAGWHHWLDGRKSEWTPGVGDGQGGLACCGSWGRKESDTTERLNWTELKVKHSRKSTGFIYRQTYLNASHKLLWAI